MPIYEYQCQSCGHELEKLQRMNDDALKDCPECGKSSLKRLISAAAFRLKGTGWYETDFKKDNRRNLVDSDGDSGNSTSASSKDSEKDSAKDSDKSSAKDTGKDSAKSPDKDSGKNSDKSSGKNSGKETRKNNAGSSKSAEKTTKTSSSPASS